MLTNTGLVSHVKKALAEKWGYVWGTFGEILTAALLQAKIKQYPDGVGQYETFIRQTWLGRRTSDCVGLIKSFIWWNGGSPVYNSKSDVSANGMYTAAKEKGPINTIPEIPGICVWKDGHIGVYIGNGQVIEAHGTKSGVIQTPLSGAGATPWTHWLKCPFITYEVIEGMQEGDKGEEVKALQTKLNKIGYRLVVDGDFGLATETAVKSFQIGNAMPAHGIADKPTVAAIDAMIKRLEPGKPVLGWKEILKKAGVADDWDEKIEDISKNDPRFKYLPTLIEKIYNAR
ncbi:MAG: peptidoglycan-binding protein [Clostridia bacterium]|nr:peptidoglycan-binding protein [Clostridia bacterium]